MARRNQWKVDELNRKKEQGLAGPFFDALKTLDNIEERAIYALVDIKLTTEDILNTLLDPEHIRLLRSVVSLAKPQYNVMSVYLKPYIARISIEASRFNVYPFDSNIVRDVPKESMLGQTLDQIMGISVRYDKVRQVVKWMNKNATVGACRYYWPAMCALLPADHEIHSCDGVKFRDILGVASMIETFRETSPIVAGAVMIPEIKQAREAVILHYGEDNKTVGLL